MSTNSNNSTALLSVAIRLDVGSSNGTQKYIESVQSLVSMCDGFWTTRYMNPLARVEKLRFYFYTYNGTPIPLEKMLQQRRTTNLLTLTNRIITILDVNVPFNVPFLFDGLSPLLANRVKRYFQLMLKLNVYEAVAPGLAPNSGIGIAPNVSNSYEGTSYR